MITAARSGQLRSRCGRCRSRRTARGSSSSMKPMRKHGSRNRCCPCSTACRLCRSRRESRGRRASSGRPGGARSDLRERRLRLGGFNVLVRCSLFDHPHHVPRRCEGGAATSRSRCAPTDAGRGHSTKWLSVDEVRILERRSSRLALTFNPARSTPRVGGLKRPSPTSPKLRIWWTASARCFRSRSFARSPGRPWHCPSIPAQPCVPVWRCSQRKAAMTSSNRCGAH